MSREYKILKALNPVFPYAPLPIIYSEDEAVMGAPFYLMERLNGIILRKNIPKEMVLSKEELNKLPDIIGQTINAIKALKSEDIEQVKTEFTLK